MSTLFSAAKNAFFCPMIVLVPSNLIAMIFPGVQDENPICWLSDCAVKKLKNNVSPDSALPSPFKSPPSVFVSISISEVIKAIAPVSFFIVSPFCNVHITIGNAPPRISYSILYHLFFNNYYCSGGDYPPPGMVYLSFTP